MTIASEITRLQGAKTRIKASIENKGVVVPSGAKYDDYPYYIDQITGGGGGGNCGCEWIAGMKTAGMINVAGGRPSEFCSPAISREDNGTYYGLCALCYFDGDNDLWPGVCTFKKTSTATDIQYGYGAGAYVDNGDSGFVNFSVYKNGNNVRAFTFCDYSRASYQTLRYSQGSQYDWDLSNNTLTVTNLGRGDYGDYNPLNYGVDLTGYSLITGSTWIGDVGIIDNGYTTNFLITLTLKGIECTNEKIFGQFPVRIETGNGPARPNTLSVPLQFTYGDYTFIGAEFSQIGYSNDVGIFTCIAFKKGWTDYKFYTRRLGTGNSVTATSAGYNVGSNDITLWVNTNTGSGYGCRYNFTNDTWSTIDNISGTPGGNDGLFTSAYMDTNFSYNSEVACIVLIPTQS